MFLTRRFALAFFLSLLIIFQFFGSHVYPASPKQTENSEKQVRVLSLEECLDIALKNNRRRMVSKSAIDIAEAQYQQALSAYWPQMQFGMKGARRDEDLAFILPGFTSTYTITGLGPAPVNAAVTVPDSKFKIMDRDSLFSALDLTYPIYTGGKRRAICDQAQIGVQAARESTRRTDLEVIRDVKRIYYGAVLALNLVQLGRDTLERLQMTLELTERLYQTGTGTVKKTDYLNTRVIVSMTRSMLALLRSNEQLAGAALVNSMGLEWTVRVAPADKEIPFDTPDLDLGEFVADTYAFNPDWSGIQLGLKAAEAKIREVQSDFFPIVALTGNLSRIDNSYDKGLMADENKNSWVLGIGLELPLFNGFRTRNRIREAAARLEKIQHEKVLLQEGLALQVQDAFLHIVRSRDQVKATGESLDAARENRKLNDRAYRNDLVETEDVIEAQLLESFITAQYFKALHDHVVSRARLTFIIGSEIKSKLKQGVIP